MNKETNKQEFDLLFQRYLSNQCSPEEIERLLRYFKIVDETTLRQYIEEEFQSPDFSPATEAEKETMAILQSRVQQAIEVKTAENKVYYILRWAAAAVFILLAGGALVWRTLVHVPKTDLKESPTIARKAEQIVPGHSGATLQLANGKTVLLDSTANGTQMMQDQVRITKKDGQIVYSGATESIAYNTITTDRGREWQVVLPDGTKVWLNAATTIKFPTSFDPLSSRTVELEGEAYFEVAENKDKPFSVHTAMQDIRDIGTHFNVSCYPDDPFTKTTLLEGAVQINGSKTLRPGQQATTTHEGRTEVTAASTEAAIAWKNGYFDFNDENIYDIMRKVARWYNVEVIYRGKIPTESMVGTISRFDDISRLLSVIRKTGLLEIAISGKTIYIDGKQSDNL